MKISIQFELSSHLEAEPLTIFAKILQGESSDISAGDMAKAIHFLIDQSRLSKNLIDELKEDIGEKSSTYKLFAKIAEC